MAEPSRTVALERWRRRRVALLVASLTSGVGCATSSKPCPRHPLAVQVLGSGGPIADDARSSASYLVWIDGEARALVDAGGGSFVRFGASGARIEDLDLVGITHLHTDHVGDVPALLKSAYFSHRRRDLPVVGPSGGGLFPSWTEWLRTHFDPERGSYRYLSWASDPERGPFSIVPREVDAATREPVTVHVTADLEVRVVGVEHGPVPALAFSVVAGDTKVVFGGDQNGRNAHFAVFARDADILVVHHAVPERADPVAGRLHARPSEIGRLATAARARSLVLSHLMARSLRALPQSLEIIESIYDGPIRVAEDMDCIVPPP